MLGRLLNRPVKKLLSLVVRTPLGVLIGLVFWIMLKPVPPKTVLSDQNKGPKQSSACVLVLSYDSFRSDINYIQVMSRYRFLIVPSSIVRLIAAQFYPANLLKYNDIDEPDKDNYIFSAARKKHRSTIERILKLLYRLVPVKGVIAPHFRYIADVDFGAVSERIGVPFVLLPRDSQFGSSKFLMTRLRKLFQFNMPRFEGSMIIVQSRLDVPIYVETGFVAEEKIHVLGCPRMDSFLSKLECQHLFKEESDRKRIVFLPFSHKNIEGVLERDQLANYVNSLNRYFVEFAIDNPKVDVIVKPKFPPEYRFPNIEYWRSNFETALDGRDINLEEVTNFSIQDEDLLDLFFSVDVVCGLNTTALIEAGIMGLPIVVPYFEILKTHYYRERLFYVDDYDLFDVANNLDELNKIMKDRIFCPAIPKPIMERRKILFEDYISTLDGNATKRYVEILEEFLD